VLLTTVQLRAGGPQEVITDDREIVSTIRARLADRVGKDRYEVWFGATTQLTVRGESLVVSAPNQFFQDWLRSHFRKDLEASSLEAVGKPLELEFRIADRKPSPSTESPRVKALPHEPQPPAKADGPPVSSSVGQAAASAGPALRRRLARLEGFVVGNSNCLAHKAAQMAAEQPGTYSPLLIHGPSGTGKSHLLEGICSAFRKARPRAGMVYLSAEQFTGHFLEALHGSGMPSFRRKYRGLELLVIDDLQFFTNKRATLVELLHTIDELLRAGRQLVFTADRSPAALKSLGPELAARISGGMVCRLEPAEYATRLGIVHHHARHLGLNVPAEVEAFIASHFTTQSRELAGALKRLQASSLAHERPISLALAEEALCELIDHQGRAVKLADIEKAVCDVFGIQPESLQSTRKVNSVSHPRMLAMWLARKHTRAALSEIGCYFGRRSHSTVISAQKKVTAWMAQGSSLQLADGSLSLEEAIRRVEENLRAG
jgi:chromosomal replication initiator protein